MSEPMVKQRPTVDLDDFERRIRQLPAQHVNDDPLAELARLVGEQYDPYGDVFSQEHAAQHPAQAARASGDRHEPTLQQGGGSQRLFGDFAAIEAGLRGGVGPHAEPPATVGLGMAQTEHDFYDETSDAFGHPVTDESWQDRSFAEPAPAPSRRPVLAVAATIAVGVLGIGAAFALKGHVSSSPREIRTIMADAGPTKIQPPADASGEAASVDNNVMGKGGQTTPTSLVSREEQPVDIAQAVQDNVAKAAQTAQATGSGGMTDASSVPVPPSPAQVQTAMADPKTASGQGDPIGEQAGKFGLSDMPAPKRVKVVSVRPDGTILPDEQPAAPPASAPRQAAAKTSDRVGPVAKPSTPKSLASKTTQRVAAAPKTIESIAGNGDDDAAAAPARKAKPQRVASAEPEHEASPAEVGGGFAVQLAAPGSEADAKTASSRLGKKFAGALGAHHLGFHKAESNGRSVYRVRVSSLSRSEAVTLCEKLKSEGGSCFVARN